MKHIVNTKIVSITMLIAASVLAGCYGTGNRYDQERPCASSPQPCNATPAYYGTQPSVSRMNQQQTAVTYPGAVPSKPACVGCNKSVQPTDVRKKPTPPQGSYAAPMPAPTPNAAYYSQPPQASAATEVACLEDALAKAEAEKAALLLEQERLRAEQARLKSEQNKMAEKIKKEKACDEVKDWNAVEGSTLRGLLTDWGDQVGWRVVWNMDRDYTLEAGAVFRGRFTDVSAALLRSFARARPAPKGVFYNGNKVLVISTREDENAE